MCTATSCKCNIETIPKVLINLKLMVRIIQLVSNISSEHTCTNTNRFIDKAVKAHTDWSVIIPTNTHIQEARNIKCYKCIQIQYLQVNYTNLHNSLTTVTIVCI